VRVIGSSAIAVLSKHDNEEFDAPVVVTILPPSGLPT
jgi:hypothetical protein